MGMIDVKAEIAKLDAEIADPENACVLLELEYTKNYLLEAAERVDLEKSAEKLRERSMAVCGALYSETRRDICPACGMEFETTTTRSTHQQVLERLVEQMSERAAGMTSTTDPNIEQQYRLMMQVAVNTVRGMIDASDRRDKRRVLA